MPYGEFPPVFLRGGGAQLFFMHLCMAASYSVRDRLATCLAALSHMQPGTCVPAGRVPDTPEYSGGEMELRYEEINFLAHKFPANIVKFFSHYESINTYKLQKRETFEILKH